MKSASGSKQRAGVLLMAWCGPQLCSFQSNPSSSSPYWAANAITPTHLQGAPSVTNSISLHLSPLLYLWFYVCSCKGLCNCVCVYVVWGGRVEAGTGMSHAHDLRLINHRAALMTPCRFPNVFWQSRPPLAQSSCRCTYGRFKWVAEPLSCVLPCTPHAISHIQLPLAGSEMMLEWVKNKKWRNKVVESEEDNFLIDLTSLPQEQCYLVTSAKGFFQLLCWRHLQQ